MAKVIARVKILPKDIATKPDVILNSISGFKLIKYQVEPIAFGLNAIIADFELDDAEGGTDPLEQALLTNKLISEMEVIGVSNARTKL
ncbi:MAG: elongation factor 1-beta [Nitrososphaerota archaeon]|jgi:elongation factor 1-beta|nr:elongation factor 1-beta [Nitrososphaerota archaeon]MDG6927620.1 elongation factor 1-beta [Nitrososphaerota archaeon]MDG6929943.1 elongation factor 1-beta [Nitrososphaerota archaeon]MDG6931607.1 elongation factor 1-beta [Nitrososphaerota archaeon]MDG6935976.1 elongation factor 1-beta [Nitrososphaerota archaeon]